MAENSLVAPEEGAKAVQGAGAVEGLTNTCVSITRGDWAGGLLGGAGAAMEAASVLSDPLAGLASAGFGWLMEHVEFLKEPLDALTGDQGAIGAMSQTWSNVSAEVKGAAEEYGKAVEADIAAMHGEAVDAYREHAQRDVAYIGGVATACSGVSQLVSMCGTVLDVVRGIVRDLISRAVGELVAAALEWMAAEALSFGLATPGMIADLIRRAVTWANKISKWTDKITGIFKDAWTKLDELGEGVKKVKEMLEKAATKVSQPFGEGSNISRQKISNSSLEVEGLGGAKGMDVDLAPGKADISTRLGGPQVDVQLNAGADLGNAAVGKAKEETAKAIDGSDAENDENESGQQ